MQALQLNGRFGSKTLRLRWSIRLATAVSGLLVLIALIAARFLTPSSEGYGTHQQLGLPPCMSIVLFGTQCPACGMTTACAFAMRGQWMQAANANWGGLILAAIALAYLPVSCYLFAVGTASRNGNLSLTFGCGILVALAAAIVQWTMRR